MRRSNAPTTTVTPARAASPVGPAWRDWHLVGLAGLTWYSTAIGWQAQAVSYPLFLSAGAAEFPAYHLAYNHAIPAVVIVPGFVCFLACIAFPWTRPAGQSRALAVVVSLTGLVSLVSTVAWAIPMHDRLDEIGQDAATVDSLLAANLVRSLALTTGALVLSWVLGRRLSGR